ncbi:MAG: pyridoxamine 5'-phosphate oxidase [Thermoleophilia bacterium]|nr:pyridoxamine 5'-phosphate oxidase [Thermoleophilia bacterium]
MDDEAAVDFPRVDSFLDALAPDPHVQFEHWFSEARAAGLWEPEAAALATATATGAPSVRLVLVRGHDARGFVFYTNRESRKGLELAENPRVALAFFWAPPLERQVRIEGSIEALCEEESAAYFSARPRASRIGAWASPQSRPLTDREELDRLVTETEARFAEEPEVPLPPFWGGYRVVAETVEVWQGRPSRLHDRVRYTRSDGAWARERLAP